MPKIRLIDGPEVDCLMDFGFGSFKDCGDSFMDNTGDKWEKLPFPLEKCGIFLSENSYVFVKKENLYGVVQPRLGWGRIYETKSEALKDFCSLHKTDYKLLCNGM